MATAIIIRAKYKDVEYNLSMAMWAEKFSMAKSYFRRIKIEGEEKGLKDQELIDYILSMKGRRAAPRRALNDMGAVALSEGRALAANSKFWYMFNFGRACVQERSCEPG